MAGEMSVTSRNVDRKIEPTAELNALIVRHFFRRASVLSPHSACDGADRFDTDSTTTPVMAIKPPIQ